jgi:CheY-like chemotaxis protein
VELHGGSIEATSAGPRLGTTFTVDLPLRRVERESRPVGSADAEESRLDLVRVLVVDDDADTRELLSLALKEQGASVVDAQSVAEAHQLLPRFRPDVVLCDISMPGEDGFRFLEWIKMEASRPAGSIPVVALTAHARAEDRHRILAAGFKGYLAKPLELPDMIRLVRSVTSRPRSV